jgi:thiol-disulfide isomerase/thioredoxin
MRSKNVRNFRALPVVAGGVAFFAMLPACDEPSTVEGPARARVESVGARRSDPAERFCDRSSPESEGAPFVPPSATEGGPIFDGPAGWRWLNVWASWCAPCVEELPLLAAWEGRLGAEGVPVEIGFVSVDATAEAVTSFRAGHPEVPGTRLTDPAGLPGLVVSLGLDPGATLPIHALVDPSGRLRCVRTGAVAERDYGTVREILGGR